MTLFRNPLVVGALVLIAAALVLSNLIWPGAQGQRWRSASSHLADSVTGAPDSARSPRLADVRPAGSASPAKPSALVDWVAAEASLARWMHAPRRDPFRSGTGSGGRATAALTLKGIWRQTGGNFAVIDDHLVGEGDQISDLRIERIEADRVWVIGPNGREELGFKPPVKGPPLGAEPDLNRTAPQLNR